MRQLLILITFISSLIVSSVAHAEWTKVEESDIGDISYVDFERIKKHNGKIYYWLLTDYSKSLGYGIFSFKGYAQAECGRLRYRYINQTYYKGPMGSGKIEVIVNTPEKEWYYPRPNSTGEGELKAVCNHKTMQ